MPRDARHDRGVTVASLAGARRPPRERHSAARLDAGCLARVGKQAAFPGLLELRCPARIQLRPFVCDQRRAACGSHRRDWGARPARTPIEATVIVSTPTTPLQ